MKEVKAKKCLKSFDFLVPDQEIFKNVKQITANNKQQSQSSVDLANIKNLVVVVAKILCIYNMKDRKQRKGARVENSEKENTMFEHK